MSLIENNLSYAQRLELRNKLGQVVLEGSALSPPAHEKNSCSLAVVKSPSLNVSSIASLLAFVLHKLVQTRPLQKGRDP